MLSKSNRMSRADFPTRRGSRAVFSWGAIEVFSTLPASGAVIASKKNFKTSVERHQVKRKVRAALAHYFSDSKGTGGIVAYPNKKALRMTPREILKELSEKLLPTG